MINGGKIMVDKNADSNRIKILEDYLLKPKKEIKRKAKTLYKKVPPQTPREIPNEERRTEGRILSAGKGAITENGGPSKYIGSQTNNSIWDSDVLFRLAGIPTNKEQTLEIRSEIRKLRNGFDQERFNKMAEDAQNVDLRKDATVQNAGEFTERASNYKRPQNNMSIFDTTFDFERVPEKTAGEKASERAREVKAKDNSWKKRKGTFSTRNIMDQMIDNLLSDKKKEKDGSQ